MRRLLFILASPLWLLACPNGNGNDGGTGGGSGGGSGGSGGATGFEVQVLDPTTSDRRWLAAAYDKTQNRIGVAYFARLTTKTNVLNPDSGTTEGFTDYAVKYVEWKNGAAGTPETIVPKVNVNIGIALAFQPSGEPAVAYIGGGNEENSLVWLQSDMMLARRSGGTWTQTTVAINGGLSVCGNGVSDRGHVAGLWPAMAYDPSGKLYLFWRDVHDGQFPNQDWTPSDVELNELTGAGAPTNVCLAEGGNSKSAWGGRISVVMAHGQPLVIYDQCDVNGPEAEGRNVIWQRRKSDNTWTAPRLAMPVGNTQTGASLAFDDLGNDAGTFGVAVVDRGSDTLSYIESADGEGWTIADPVYASGSGGWYPSLAFDPVNHEPAIAWYLCSNRGGVDETSCPTGEDELRISQRIVGNWRTVAVDRDGAWLPRLGFFPSGKRWVVYRGRQNGDIKVATEK